ncbi:alpha/beta fold hydrolase [Pseudonocardia humida]|uniref:Alpha/beta fold hydrolase n=1 Tax=Pseudonocardia humida TaxID=2800819 RepID=A0ABT1A0F2_9PSEU|nr:alpha/beta hydrolase [Pseudonocardia humida]MCO1656418.1 alpha/beta fold hydrolase [Pseudonocardia humida]
MTEERVRIYGMDVHVSVRPAPDAATPLLLLMGIGGNTEMWHPLRDLLGADRTTVAFDIPGTGRSATPPVPLPLPLLGRIATRVLDHAGIDRADVLGVSWGGLLAQQVALAHRKRVRRVVLASTHFGMASVPATPTALRTLLSTRRYRDVDAFAEALAHFGGGPGRDVEGMRGHIAARLAHPPTRRGYWYQMLSISTWSSLPLLPLLRRPTLLLAGDDDPAVPAINARIMAKLLPDAELVVVPGGGHLMLFDRAREIAPVIRRFLA